MFFLCVHFLFLSEFNVKVSPCRSAAPFFIIGYHSSPLSLAWRRFLRQCPSFPLKVSATVRMGFAFLIVGFNFDSFSPAFTNTSTSQLSTNHRTPCLAHRMVFSNGPFCKPFRPGLASLRSPSASHFSSTTQLRSPSSRSTMTRRNGATASSGRTYLCTSALPSPWANISTVPIAPSPCFALASFPSFTARPGA